MDFFLKACSIGFLLSIMMGPVFFILIETSIRRGFRAAVAFDLGVLLSDAIYIVFAKVFIAEVSLIDTTENKALFAFIGGGLFIVYGVYNFFKKYQISENESTEASEVEKKDYLKLCLKGFLLNFANPLVIFYWFSVITLADQSVGAESGEFKMFVFLGVVLLTFFLFDLLKILGANKTRLLNYMSGLGSKHIFVNIPGNYLLAVNDNKIEFQTKVVVGRDERQTPTISSDIYEINFFPFWHIPGSIVQKDIAKAMQVDSEYLKKNNILIYQDYYYKDTINPEYIDWYSDEPTLFKFRQNPGYTNSLGVAKINFANKHAVFLHDTPNKSLFSDGQRFFSSGCVRVQNIDDLIQWLLSSNKGWTWNKLENILNIAQTTTVRMDEEIPIKIGYLTAWYDNGLVHFREDIYGKDPVR